MAQWLFSEGQGFPQGHAGLKPCGRQSFVLSAPAHLVIEKQT